MKLEDITVGDYVVADNAMHDTWDETFIVLRKDRENMLGQTLVDVADSADRSRRLAFLPSELSHES